MKLKSYRRFKKFLFDSWRIPSAADRALPSFLVIGAQKCGTTSLFQYLKAHPQIFPGAKKEIHFFDGGNSPDQDIFETAGEEWYRAHFPKSSKLIAGSQVFEASPSYLYIPKAAERISAMLPNARLVVLLRDPVQRAISHYGHNLAKGREPFSFAEALAREEERISCAGAHARRRYSYRDRGFYISQLKRYESYRDNRRLMVIDSRLLFNNTSQVMRDLYNFVGVDPEFKPARLRARNVAKQRPCVDPEAVALLRETYRPYNRLLWEWLGCSFGWD